MSALEFDVEMLVRDTMAPVLAIPAPIGECSRCRCRLYPADLAGDTLPCETGCPARADIGTANP